MCFPLHNSFVEASEKMQSHKFLIAGRYRGVHCTSRLGACLKFSIIKVLKERIKEEERRMGIYLRGERAGT